MATDWTSSVDLLVEFDRRHGVRQGIEHAIREAIRDGRLRLGAALPSTRALASDLGVSRGTVSEAYGQLAAEGYVTARQGAASRVVWVPPAPAEPVPSAPERTASWDLRPGRVDSSSFPRELWAKTMRRVLQTLPEETLGYGDSRGTPQLREAMTLYLGRARGVRTDPSHLLVCAGFTQALVLVCEALRATGARAVAMEDPNAPRYRSIVAAAGLEVLSVPCDDDGLRTDALRRVHADAIVATPAHQYPLGSTLSARRRGALIQWARANDAIVVEDDYDGEFRFDRHPVAALQQMDPDHVVYVGTASKTLAPGLRLGWLTLAPKIRDGVVAVKERLDRGNGVLDQLALAHLVTSGDFDRHVRRMRTAYRWRRDELLEVLSHCAPELRVAGIAAGMHAVVDLPDPAYEDRLVAEAGRRSLLLHTLADYWHRPDPAHRPAFIVGYGTPAAHAFRPALHTLAAALTATTRR